MKDFLFGNLEIKRIKLRDLPVHVQVWSYLIVFVPILCIPGYAIYKLMISPGNDISEVRRKEKRSNGENRFVVFFFFLSAFRTSFAARRNRQRTRNQRSLNRRKNLFFVPLSNC